MNQRQSATSRAIDCNKSLTCVRHTLVMDARNRWFAIALCTVSTFVGRTAIADERAMLLAEQMVLSVAVNRPVLVVAHRGCWKHNAPENSLSAFKACVDIGADAIEMDVRRTRDGVLVIMHDETVDRTTNGKGRVQDLTLKQLRKLRLRKGSGGPRARLTREAPPTFEEAMIALRGSILVNVDAKTNIFKDALDVLERTGTAGQVIMKRGVHAADAPLLQVAPFNRVFAMPIVSERTGTAAALLQSQLTVTPPAVELVFADLAYLHTAAPLIQQAGSRVWVNTLKSKHAGGMRDVDALAHPDAVWGRLIDAGATVIQTDEPLALRKYLESKGRRPPADF
jgi:glycerophosphoryl diester phosphodiesterase